MRQEGVADLMKLAILMQGRSHGVSLADIQEEFGVQLRTAHRMRNALLQVFPDMTAETGADRIKRWRLPKGTLGGLITTRPEELAALNAAVNLLQRENRNDEADNLAILGNKVAALLPGRDQARVDPDLEALLEAEGLATRPGPRPRIDQAVKETLRTAIKACAQVKLTYRNRLDGRRKVHRVHPYGFLHGHRHYLVAWKDRPGQTLPSLFSLSNIDRVEMLNEPFERPPDFSLKAFAKRAFGVYQEREIYDVVWRFSPLAADTAEEFQFHPDQTMHREEDGSLVVRFRAGGDLEMAWHLLTWGNHVEVLEPRALADMIKDRQAPWKGLP